MRDYAAGFEKYPISARTATYHPSFITFANIAFAGLFYRIDKILHKYKKKSPLSFFVHLHIFQISKGSKGSFYEM
jgi:hypothetical protein